MPAQLTKRLVDVGFYCLTVKGTTRCKLLQCQANKNRIDVLFVYGKPFDFDSIKKDGGDLSDHRWHSLSMFGNNPGYIFRAYSCAAGHREILLRFIDSKHKYALILEDDALYPLNIKDVCRKLIEDYPGQHYFNLSTESFISKASIPELMDVNKLHVVYGNSALGLGMYLIDRYFAEYALSNMLNTLHLPADVVIWNEWSPMQLIAVVYGTGVALSPENLNSLIGYGILQ